MPYVGREIVKGQNRELDDISSSFNSGNTAFTMQVGGVTTSAASVNQVFISLGGVMQHPGTDYTVSSSTLTFTTAPDSGLAFWGLIQGNQVDTGTPSDGTVGSSKFASGDLTFPSDITIPDKIVHTGDTNTSIRFPAADTITGETGGSERIRIDSIGNVGLGGITAAPTSTVYNGASLHLHQSTGGAGGGSQIKMTTSQSGSAAGDGAYLAYYGNNQLYIYNRENAAINFGTNSTERLSIGTTGDVTITDGNLVLANGHGIDFSATADTTGSNATSESELLDDYERGYFTPTVAGTTAAGTLSYSSQYGYYVKIGRIVHCWFDVTISSASGMTGVFCINNLPFAKSFLGSQAFYYEGGSFWNVGDNLSNTKPVVAGYIPNSSTKFLIYSADTMGTKTTLVLNTAGRVSGYVAYTPTT